MPSGPRLAAVDFNRYPDREATELRQALADSHGVGPEQVFCANGSNEVLQSLLLAYGGPGRTVALFEPTYTSTARSPGSPAPRWSPGSRTDDFLLDLDEVRRVIDAHRPGPHLPVLAQQPDRPGRQPRPDRGGAGHGPRPAGGGRGLRAVRPVLGPGHGPRRRPGVGPRGRGPDLLQDLVDGRCATRLPGGRARGDPGLRAGGAALPPRRGQAAGRPAGPRASCDEMEARVALLNEERGRIAAALADLPVQSWPSDANFILFRPPAGRGPGGVDPPPRRARSSCETVRSGRGSPDACG